MPEVIPVTAGLDEKASPTDLSQDPYSLTNVEKDIFTRTSLGQTLGEIACALDGGIHEIFSMQRNIAWQFGTISNEAAVNRGIQRGIISIEFDAAPIEATADEAKFLRLLSSGRDYAHIGNQFNHASRDTVAFFCTHMAMLLDAKVDVEGEENANLVRRAHEARLIS